MTRLVTPDARKHRAKRIFTPEEYILIREAWHKLTPFQIGRRLDCHRDAVIRGASEIGLPAAYPAAYGMVQPTEKAWTRAAMAEAESSGIAYSLIIGPCQDRAVCHARWRAWARMKAENPNYSIIGIARASSRDHTSILHAFKRMRRANPSNAAEVPAGTTLVPPRAGGGEFSGDTP